MKQRKIFHYTPLPVIEPKAAISKKIKAAAKMPCSISNEQLAHANRFADNPYKRMRNNFLHTMFL